MRVCIDLQHYVYRGGVTVMANAISISRLILVAIAMILLQVPGVGAKVAATALITTVFLLDALDGYIARVRNEVSGEGAALDIVIDRCVEYYLWGLFASLELVSYLPFLVVNVKAWFDIFKLSACLEKEQQEPSFWEYLLVGGRPIRAFYGCLKGGVLTGFAAFMAVRDVVGVVPSLATMLFILQGLSYLVAAVSLVRLIPIVSKVFGFMRLSVIDS